jgi:hypothetical protein
VTEADEHEDAEASGACSFRGVATVSSVAATEARARLARTGGCARLKDHEDVFLAYVEVHFGGDHDLIEAQEVVVLADLHGSRCSTRAARSRARCA